MTNMEIDIMPAGKQIDCLIETEIYKSTPLTGAEYDFFKAASQMHTGQKFSDMEEIRLFKIALNEPDYQTGLMFRLCYPRSYSAHEGFKSYHELVSKMRDDGWLFSLYEIPGSGEATLHIAAFERLPRPGVKGCQGKAEAHTDALAICRAALKAKLAERTTQP